MSAPHTKRLLLILGVACVIVGCTSQSGSTSKEQLHEITQVCLSTNQAQCLRLIKQKYSQTTHISHKQALLNIALEMFLKHGQTKKAIDAFHRLITLANENTARTDDEWICQEIDLLHGAVKRYAAWLFLEQALGYLQSLKLSTLNACQEKFDIAMATALSEQHKLTQSSEILNRLKSKGVSDEEKDAVDFLLANNAFLSDKYDQCILTLTHMENQAPKTQMQGSMSLLLSSCLDLSDKQGRALDLLEKLHCCPTVVDLELVKLKKSVIKKRQAVFQESL